MVQSWINLLFPAGGRGYRWSQRYRIQSRKGSRREGLTPDSRPSASFLRPAREAGSRQFQFSSPVEKALSYKKTRRWNSSRELWPPARRPHSQVARRQARSSERERLSGARFRAFPWAERLSRGRQKGSSTEFMDLQGARRTVEQAGSGALCSNKKPLSVERGHNS